MIHYAYKSDYEDYTDTDTTDLPTEIQRKLDQAEDLIEQVIRGNGHPEIASLTFDYSSSEKEITDTIADIDSNEYGNDIITLESSLSDSFSVTDRSRIKTTNPEDQRLLQRKSLRDAVCSQVEYWEQVGDELGILSEVEDISISKFSLSGKGGLGRLAPKAKTALHKSGLLYAGVVSR